jgi:hypothetical protein
MKPIDIKINSNKWTIFERTISSIIKIIRISDNLIIKVGDKITIDNSGIIYTIDNFSLPCYCDHDYFCNCCKNDDYHNEELWFYADGGEYGFRGIISQIKKIIK